MEPRLINKPEMILAGIVGCGPDVSRIDIHGLWERFGKYDGNIKHQVEGTGYEIHIQEDENPSMHFCLAGAEVREIDDLPVELFIKTLPACQYAVFTHYFKDGDYGKAYKTVNEWLENSDYISAYPFDIQCYDSRFKGPGNPESVIEIYVPVKNRCK